MFRPSFKDRKFEAFPKRAFHLTKKEAGIN